MKYAIYILALSALAARANDDAMMWSLLQIAQAQQSASGPTTDYGDNLLVWYPASKTGNLNDYSGNGHNASNAGATVSASGIWLNGYSGEVFRVWNNVWNWSTGAVLVSFNYKPDWSSIVAYYGAPYMTVMDASTELTAAPNAYNGLMLAQEPDGEWRLSAGSNAGEYSANVNLGMSTNATWTHVIYWRSNLVSGASADKRVWVNGVETYGGLVGITAGNPAVSSNLVFGLRRQGNITNNHFKGWIDDVRIYNFYSGDSSFRTNLAYHIYMEDHK